jgi:hypothetical protein
MKYLRLKSKCTRLENIYNYFVHIAAAVIGEGVHEKKGQAKLSLAPNLLLN